MVRISSQTAINKMSGGLSQQFCVRWNSHLGSLGAAFPQLLAGQRFVDVTLACEGHQVHCHRLVLAACSSYFESLLGENPCKHPIIILPRDIKLWEIQALVDFMYKGEVNVSQAGLPDLLKCAEALQIRGLCGSDAALNLNQISTNTLNTSTNTSSQPVDTKTSLKNNIATSTPKGSQQQHQFLSNSVSNTGSTTNISHASVNTTQSRSVSPSKSPAPVISAQENSQTIDDLRNDTPSPMIVQPPIEPTVDLEEGDDSVNGSNSEMNDEPDLKMQFEYDDTSNIKLEPEDEQLFHHHVNQLREEQASHFGKIRVKSNENLFENYKKSNHHPTPYNLNTNKHNVNMPTTPTSTSLLCYDLQSDDNTRILPSSLKFNSNSMTIFVTNKSGDATGDESIGGSNQDINSYMTDEQMMNSNNENGYENIICAPNLLSLSCNSNDEDGSYNMNSSNDNLLLNDRQTSSIYDVETNVNSVDSSTKVENRKSNFLPPLLPFDGSKEHKDSRKKYESFLSFEECLRRGGPPPGGIVLRSPRGNQPRTYNIQALWAALVDVKAGESIYRASQIHKVPRKTLRNWMKRWNIKSAYPMPRQLRQAAEKRKATNTQV